MPSSNDVPRDPSAQYSEDPLLHAARREALLVTAVFIAALAYTVWYCTAHAYDQPVRLIAGFPDWVVWGILLPWGICAAFSLAFALFVMRDDPLGAAVEDWNPEAQDSLLPEDAAHG